MHNFLKLKLCFKKKNWFWGDMLKLWSDWSYQDPSLHLDRHQLTIRNQFSAFPAASELHADSSTQPKQEQRWEETKQKYSITVEFSGICTWVFSSDNFLLLHTTFFFFWFLYFLLLTSLKQTCYFWFVGTEGSYFITAGHQHQADLSLNSNTWKALLFVY